MRVFHPLYSFSIDPVEGEFSAAMTAYEVAGFDFLPCRLLGCAQIDRVLTARVEIAPAGRCGRIGDFALKDDALAHLARGKRAVVGDGGLC